MKLCQRTYLDECCGHDYFLFDGTVYEEFYGLNGRCDGHVLITRSVDPKDYHPALQEALKRHGIRLTM